MNRNIRILILLVLLIIIPFLIYAILQARAFRADEQMADEIYEKQMDAVLFSLNQYANDVMNQWLGQLEDDDNTVYDNAAALLLGNESIQVLALRDMTSGYDTLIYNDYIKTDEFNSETITQWYDENRATTQQLQSYLEVGFQKVQAVEEWQSVNGLSPLQTAATFMFYDSDSVLFNSLIILEANYWAEQILGGKMAELGGDNFRLSVLQMTEDSDEPLILHETQAFDLTASSFQRPLWILPKINLMIQPMGESYSDLIRTRNRTNLYFLLFSVAIVLLGAFLIIRNIRSTVKIAQLKSDFVSNVSHEIRTPISLIRMYAETLMLGRIKSEEKKQQYYDVIHHESGRLTYLVNNILDFSRIEANRKTYAMEAVDLNNLVEQVYLNYNYTFKEKNVEASLSLVETELPVKIDPSAFEEALSNLIDNAIKYSDGNIRLDITSGKEDGYAYCNVKDFGRGIDRNEVKHIFEKFYRVEDAMTQKTKGTGLGLSLVKHVMDAHNGQVDVSSQPGEGSIFTLKFPIINTLNG